MPPRTPTDCGRLQRNRALRSPPVFWPTLLSIRAAALLDAGSPAEHWNRLALDRALALNVEISQLGGRRGFAVTTTLANATLNPTSRPTGNRFEEGPLSNDMRDAKELLESREREGEPANELRGSENYYSADVEDDAAPDPRWVALPAGAPVRVHEWLIPPLLLLALAALETFDALNAGSIGASIFSMIAAGVSLLAAAAISTFGYFAYRDLTARATEKYLTVGMTALFVARGVDGARQRRLATPGAGRKTCCRADVATTPAVAHDHAETPMEARRYPRGNREHRMSARPTAYTRPGLRTATRISHGGPHRGPTHFWVRFSTPAGRDWPVLKPQPSGRPGPDVCRGDRHPSS